MTWIDGFSLSDGIFPKYYNSVFNVSPDEFNAKLDTLFLSHSPREYKYTPAPVQINIFQMRAWCFWCVYG